MTDLISILFIAGIAAIFVLWISPRRRQSFFGFDYDLWLQKRARRIDQNMMRRRTRRILERHRHLLLSLDDLSALAEIARNNEDEDLAKRVENELALRSARGWSMNEYP